MQTDTVWVSLKDFEESEHPRIPAGQEGAGQFAPKYVGYQRGVDLSEQYDPQSLRIEYPNYIDATPLMPESNKAAYDLLDRQGFNQLPAHVSDEDMEAEIAAGGQRVYRGVHDNNATEMSGEDIADQFHFGRYQVGSGVIGNGTYTTSNASQALPYANDYVNGSLMEMVIRHDAKLIRIDKLEQEWESSGYKSVMGLSEFGVFKGYDASWATLNAPFQNIFNVFNRTAVLMRASGESIDDRGNIIGDLGLRGMPPDSIKAFDESAHPRIPAGQPGAGRFAPKYLGYIIGREIPFDEVYGLAEVSDYSKFSTLSESKKVAEDILAKQGFDQLPTHVSDAEFDAELAIDGSKHLWRGVRKFEDFSGQDLQDRLQMGAFFVGDGTAGLGTYTSNWPEKAIRYVGYDDGGAIVEMALRHDAKVIALSDLELELDSFKKPESQYQYSPKYKNIQRQIDELINSDDSGTSKKISALMRERDAGLVELTKDAQKWKDIDLGMFAMMRGYDAAYTGNKIDFTYEAAEDHRHYVIYNRTALLFRETGESYARGQLAGRSMAVQAKFEPRVMQAIFDTRSSKDFEESQHPRIPAGQPGAGQFAPKYAGYSVGSPMVAEDLDSWHGKTSSLFDPTPMPNDDPEFREILQKQGFDQLSAHVSPEDYQDEINRGGTRLWRGVNGKYEVTSYSMMEQFSTGQLYVGDGIFGGGTYAGDWSNKAIEFASGSERFGGDVIEMVLRADARVIDTRTLEVEYDNWKHPEQVYTGTEAHQVIRNRFRELMVQGKTDEAYAIDDEEFTKIETLRVAALPRLNVTMTKYAMLQGYDALKSTKIFNDEPVRYGSQGHYFVILNRTAVLMRADGVTSDETNQKILGTLPPVKEDDVYTKAYDESLHPRIPIGQPGAGQFAPKFVGYQRGRQISIDELTTYRPGARIMIGRGPANNDRVTRELFALQQFDQLPEKVTDQEFQDEIDSGGVRLWRGIRGKASGDTKGATWYDDFIDGKLYIGNGILGLGTYVTNQFEIASSYADIYLNPLNEVSTANPRGCILEMVLRHDARVVDIGSLEAEFQQYRDVLDNQPEPSTETWDLGAFAVSRGYDAISALDSSYASGEWAILNRTAVLVRKTGKALSPYGEVVVSIAPRTFAKYLADAGKAFDENLHPRIPIGQEGAGQFAPKYIGHVKADPINEQELTGWTDATTDWKVRPSEDSMVQEILRKQQFDQLPALVSDEEFQAEIDKGGVRLWRGMFEESSESRYAEQMEIGKYHIGSGVIGHGTYASSRFKDAQEYAGYDSDKQDHVYVSERPILEMVLRHDAKLVAGDKLEKEFAEFRELHRVNDPFGNRDYEGRYDKMNIGVFAALRGYDAIYVGTSKKKFGTFYAAIYNRTALMFRASGKSFDPKGNQVLKIASIAERGKS